MSLTKTQKHFLIALVIGLLIFFFLPAANGLTTTGVHFLSVFVPVIYIWLSDGGSGWSALFACTMLVLLGAYDGATTYQLLWGGSMVAMVIPFYMVANALDDCGAIMWVVRWILSRKIVHGRPVLFSILFVVSLVLASIFISPMVTVVIFFKVLRDITESVGISRDSKFFRGHGLLIGWIGQICDGTLIWGRPFILSMYALIVGFGFEKFTMNDYFKLSILYLLAACVFGLLIVWLWVRPDTKKFMDFDDEAIRNDLKANPMTRRGKVLLVGMLVVIFCYVAAFLTPLGAVQVYFNGLPVAAPVSIVVAVLALIMVDGQPAIDIGKEAARLPWNTIMFLGSVMFFGGIVGTEEYGISACLSNIITPIVASLPAMAAIFAGLLIAGIMTNVTSNAVTCMVVLSCFAPAMIAAPNIGNAQVLAFCACVVMICATAVATLAACATMSLVYCPDGIEYKGTFKYSAVLILALVLISSFVLVPLGTGLFGGLV